MARLSSAAAVSAGVQRPAMMSLCNRPGLCYMKPRREDIYDTRIIWLRLHIACACDI